MLLSNIEYIPFRLIRKFLFTEKCLVKFGRFVPYYLVNWNQIDPGQIVDQYEKYLLAKNINLSNLTILEVGVGATNSTGYDMASRGWGAIYLLEPHIEFDKPGDEALLNKICRENNIDKENINSNIHRINDINKIKTASIDLILSSNVLEHVSAPDELFAEMKRILKKDGVMLHVADYRDHFFKYPYHFLQFSKKTWNRWLNPGNFPAWRLGDHLNIIKELNLSFEILDQHEDKKNFEKIKPYISTDYNLSDPYLSTGPVVFWVEKADK